MNHWTQLTLTRRGLVTLADGPSSMGYWICDTCGYGLPRLKSPRKWPKHKHLLKNQDCYGEQRLLDLAHVYETDLLTIAAEVTGIRVTQAGWLSTMYAIVEAASEILEISRDDIGGSLSPIGEERWSITLFDTVPGGAGHVLHVEENLAEVVEAALRRVSDCECGPETSCYGCLRSYQNQRDHEYLSRGAAEQILARLIHDVNVGATSVADRKEVELPETLPPEWFSLYRNAFAAERELLLVLADGGSPRPELGSESAGGTPISISWPQHLIALDFNLEDGDREELEGGGWSVLSVSEVLQRLST